MSTVIVNTPSEFQPSKSDGLFFTVSANTTTEPKFRFVYEVYVEGYKVFDGKATPNPYGLGIIDVSRILDSYVVNYPVSYYQDTPIFTHQTGVFSRSYSNEVVEYYIKVGEEYAYSFVDNVTGFTGNGDQVGLPSVPSATYKAFLSTMGVNRKANLQNFDIGQFTLSGNPSPDFPYTTNCLFLTNSPRIRDVDPSEYYTLSFTNHDLGGSYLSEPYYVRYTFFDDSGVIITAHTYANIYENGGGPATGCTQDYINDSFTGITEYNILNVGVGPMNIFDLPANTKYYHVQLFGKAEVIPPTPSPTTSPTPTLGGQPTATPTSTATPTVTPTPTTFSCDCRNWSLQSTVGFTMQVTITGCTGLVSALYVGPYQTVYQCACAVSFNPYIIKTDTGSCGTPTTPTPTPSQTSTQGLTPTPTPSVSSTAIQNVFVRDCCTGQITYDVVVGGSLTIGDTIVISGECYQIYALDGTGIDGNYTSATSYFSCQECIADYPCESTPPNPAIEKPSVQPECFVNTGGTASCVSYEPVSEIFQFNIVNKCVNRYNNQQIMFKNRYGAWDYFFFEKANSAGLAIDRQTYEQYNTTWGSANPTKTNYSRGLTDFQTSIRETHILNSGFITTPEFVWLEELYTTNDAYLINDDCTLFPINIVGAEFVRKTKGNRSLVNVELTYTFSNNIKLLNG